MAPLPPPEKTANVVVLGAGVAGLTTALLLSRQQQRRHITVVAKHMPGDGDVEYCSPWAGANILPMSDAVNSRWERDSWPVFAELAAHHPESGVAFRDTRVFSRRTTHRQNQNDDDDAEPKSESPAAQWLRTLASDQPWFRELMPGFRRLGDHELPPGGAYNAGSAFTSVCINTAVYLPYLVGQCLKNGVSFRRASVAHVLDALALGDGGGGGAGGAAAAASRVVVNCTGLQARTLGGVEDTTVEPARGQVVLVRNDPGDDTMLVATVTTTDDDDDGGDDHDDEVFYMMNRPAGGGTILGGCYQPGRWEAVPDAQLAERIKARAVRLCPALTGGRGPEHLGVISHGVGLRPVRQGGVRIEAEKLRGGVDDDADAWVVHNYGHGGWGYQGSYGCAQRAVELVDEIISSPKSLQLSYKL